MNHALTAGALALALPIQVAVPAAFVSHFLLDMLPHYGIDSERRDTSLFWKAFTTADVLLTIILAIVAILTFDHTLEIVLCGTAATAPDYFWVAHVLRTKSFKVGETANRFSAWHAQIQMERPWALPIELLYACFMTYLVFVRWM